MRIISKYKDYYDYLQGIYGIDEKLILDRTKGTTKMFSRHDGKHVLVICGKIIEYICLNSVFYFNEDIAQFNETEELNKWSFYLRPKPVYLFNHGHNPKAYWHSDTKTYWHSDRIYYPSLSEDVHKIYPELQKFVNVCPIFIYNPLARCIDCEYPSLLELGANKQVSAKDMWIMLSEWLGKRVTEKEPEVPVGDDKTRILSAGFDLKTSFRH